MRSHPGPVLLVRPHRARHVAGAAACALVAAALAASTLGACSSTPAGGPADAGTDRSVTDTGPVGPDSSPADAGSDLPDGAGPDVPPADGSLPDGAGGDALTVPTAAEIEPGVYRELLEIDAPAPPANPQATGGDASTPSDQNRLSVLRYRAPGNPPPPVRAIVVAVPGFLGGANDFDEIGRRLVKAQQGAVELWAIDRRENLLEDLTGMQAAEAAGDPEIARAYYFRGVSVGGKTFAGFLDPADRPYMSEWGLATFMADLRAVMERIPAANRKSNVILLGHSVGASMAQAYAGWDFDGQGGAAELAGLMLLEGGAPETAVDESGYHAGTGSGLTTMPGIDAIRGDGPRFVALPGLGVAALATLEISGLAAHLAPDDINHDAKLRSALTLLESGNQLPTLTNAAALGLAIDDQYSPVSFARVRTGVATGGPFESYTSILGGQLLRPSDHTATYTWVNYDMSDPPEVTSMATISRMLYDGPSNFEEWYFPTRLSLDVDAISDLQDVPSGDWREGFGIALRHVAEMDAPVLCVGGGLGLVPDASAWDGYRTLITTTVGAGRPAAGADRQSDAGFRALIKDGLTHIDVLSAAPVAGDPTDIPTLLGDFALANTTGMVSVE
jgi:hypothetical protein